MENAPSPHGASSGRNAKPPADAHQSVSADDDIDASTGTDRSETHHLREARLVTLSEGCVADHDPDRPAE